MRIDSAVREGTYARNQLFSRSRLVAWTHRSRFQMAERLVAPFAGGVLLDYGCGDGTFLATVHEHFLRAIGTDADEAQLADCARRFNTLGNVTFEPLRSLEHDGRHERQYDVITCMEVLEHCTQDQRARVLGELRRLVRPPGAVIISVPIEIGPSLMVKQAARRLAAWRGIGNYRHSERYELRELARMVTARAGEGIPRPLYGGEHAGGLPHHGHKGFDWRTLERELTTRFAIASRRCTPVPVFGTFVNSQVWFVCHLT